MNAGLFTLVAALVQPRSTSLPPLAESDATLRTHVAHTAAFERADLDLQGGRLDDAERSLLEALPLVPASAAAAYALACAEGRRGATYAAERRLADAVESGWYDAETAAWDDDFAPLRGRARFELLLARMRAELAWRTSPAGDRAGAEPWLARARELAQEKTVVAQPTLHEGGTKTGAALVPKAPSGADAYLARGSSALERTGDAAAAYGAP